jgi:hypothetical protein
VFFFRRLEFILKQKYTKESFVIAAGLAANPILAKTGGTFFTSTMPVSY